MHLQKIPATFGDAIDEFVAHQRVFGRRYYTEEYILRAVDRFVARQGVTDLCATTFELWCKAEQHLSPNTRYARQMLVRKLCLFRRRHDPQCFVPDSSAFARPRPRRPPVLVTPVQVSSLLRAADALPPSQHCAMRAAVMRLAVVLLYTAGLRRGEVVRLQLADVDVGHGVLRIRESKFWTREEFKGTNALKKHINPTRVPIEEKESIRWLQNLRESTALLGAPERCVHVGDRESDIYELFCEAREARISSSERALTDLQGTAIIL